MNRKKLALATSASAGMVLAVATWIGTAPASSQRISSTPPIVERAATTMSVVSRAESAADRSAAGLARSDIGALLAGGAGRPDNPGRAIVGSIRLIASGLGSEGRALYVLRTDRGRICGGLVGAAGGCFEGFTADSPVNWTVGGSEAGPTTVFGFAPDRVASISIVVGDRLIPARLTNNGFYAEVDGAAPGALDALEIGFTNGTITRTDLQLRREA